MCHGLPGWTELCAVIGLPFVERLRQTICLTCIFKLWLLHRHVLGWCFAPSMKYVRGLLRWTVLNLFGTYSAKDWKIYRNVYYRIWQALKFWHRMCFTLYWHFVVFLCWSIFLWRVNKKLHEEYSVGIVAHFALRLTSMIEIIRSKTMWISFISTVSSWHCSTDNYVMGSNILVSVWPKKCNYILLKAVSVQLKGILALTVCNVFQNFHCTKL